MNFHIMYTTRLGFQQSEIELPSFVAAEQWAKDRGAKYWEIGVLTSLPPDACGGVVVDDEKRTVASI